MERWREWGLTSEEWARCVDAARELAELSQGETTPSPERLAAELAIAKEAERAPLPAEAPSAVAVEPYRRIPLE